MMFEFHERRRLRRLIYSPPVMLVLMLFLLLLLKGTWGIFVKERDSRAARTQASSSLKNATERYLNLSREMENLATPEGIERELRSKFGVAKEGEKVVVIIDANMSASGTQEQVRPGFWRRIWNFVRWSD